MWEVARTSNGGFGNDLPRIPVKDDDDAILTTPSDSEFRVARSHGNRVLARTLHKSLSRYFLLPEVAIIWRPTWTDPVLQVAPNVVTLLLFSAGRRVRAINDHAF